MVTSGVTLGIIRADLRVSRIFVCAHVTVRTDDGDETRIKEEILLGLIVRVFSRVHTYEYVGEGRLRGGPVPEFD